MKWLKNYNRMVQSGDIKSMLLQMRLTYSSCGTTGANTEGEIRKAVITEVWFAWCVLQGQGTWHEVAQWFHFHSQSSHRSIRVALWKANELIKGSKYLQIYFNILVVIRGKLQAKKRSASAQLLTGSYRSRSTLALIEFDVITCKR